ncbi:MAG: hypothetical protein U5N56_01840 [Candidatus Marinimicrobia bacterium]|nr:hypothetical protein [Candidatus Neomarinimicrobiota bacterium]
MRKAEIDIDNIMYEGKERKIKRIIEYKDYRRKKGLFISYHTIYRTRIELTPEEEEQAEEARSSIREMRKELENMPDLQRKLAEEYIKPRIEKMEQYLIDAEIKEEYKLKKAKVNTGLRKDLFNISE